MSTFASFAHRKNPHRFMYCSPFSIATISGTPPGSRMTDVVFNPVSISLYVAGIAPRCLATQPMTGTANTMGATAIKVFDLGLRCMPISAVVHRTPCG